MIRNYVVRVTNPVTAERVYFNGMVGDKFPLWDFATGSILNFRNAMRLAAQLKRIYPLVHVCGVRDSEIVIEGVGHYAEFSHVTQ